MDIEAGIALFEARAMALRPDLALTDETRTAIRAICERVNGLPLAIELAAARVRLLSPALILERLSSSLDLSSGSRDLPERQRTLRGAIDWSHELLPEPERRLFRRLAVFAGGWTAELAERVTNADGDLGLDIFDGLESLADKSLVPRPAPCRIGHRAAPAHRRAGGRGRARLLVRRLRGSASGLRRAAGPGRAARRPAPAGRRPLRPRVHVRGRPGPGPAARARAAGGGSVQRGRERRRSCEGAPGTRPRVVPDGRLRAGPRGGVEEPRGVPRGRLGLPIADSTTFHAGVFYKLGQPAASWRHVIDGLPWFAEHDNASGLARSIGMAAIILVDHGNPEVGARITGATMELVREKGVMLAPVKVLHLPDPTETSIAKLGAARAAELFAEGAATPLAAVIEQVLSMPAPGDHS